MAKARALDKRRKSIRNIRKITRTMELISTARFKRAMDRALAATAYTRRITALVGHLSRAGLEVTHPLLVARPEPRKATLLVLSANRGLCGGYNSSVLRLAYARLTELQQTCPRRDWRFPASAAFRPSASARSRWTSGSRISKTAHVRRSRVAGQPLPRSIPVRADRPARRGLHEVREPQPAVCHGRNAAAAVGLGRRRGRKRFGAEPQYDFLPSAESILDEVVPTSFKVRLFKCFLDAAVSEQIARMVAMKAATENAERDDRQPVDGVQPRPPGTDHLRTVGDHRRRRGAERIEDSRGRKKQFAAV